jgi:hypothetical protein
MKINCIVCDTEVENWNDPYPEDRPQVHPIGGTLFRTYGHYGSSVFDPMDASYLEVIVCDECLEAKMNFAHEGLDEKYRQEINDHREDMKELVKKLKTISVDI